MASRFTSFLCVVLLAALFAAIVSPAFAADWTRFRGPDGSGVAPDDKPTPTEWGTGKNLKWKLKLPGPGHSCPIVVGDKVFVTCWTGYGTDRADPGDQKNLKRALLCIDRKTGKELWSKSVEAVLPEDRYGGMFAEHGYATHTPVSDGEKVFVFYGKSGVVAYDLEGNQLWQKGVGEGLDPRNWGSSSSPVLYKDMVIVLASAESSTVFAFNKNTGEEVWKSEADGFASTWTTPVLVNVAEGKQELVVVVPNEVWGLNPENGKLIWYCETVGANSACGSPVVKDDIVYLSAGQFGGSTLAVKAGGKGDVASTHLQWNVREGGRIGTPVLHDGKLYWVDSGNAVCLDAETGDTLYKERLTGGTMRPSTGGGGPGGGGRPSGGGGQPGGGGRRPGGFGGGGGRGGQEYSSAVAADGKLYFVARNGDMFVMALGDEFEQLAMNRFEDDKGDFSATPAISNGDLFIRSTENLYCVGYPSE